MNLCQSSLVTRRKFRLNDLVKISDCDYFDWWTVIWSANDWRNDEQLRQPQRVKTHICAVCSLQGSIHFGLTQFAEHDQLNVVMYTSKSILFTTFTCSTATTLLRWGTMTSMFLEIWIMIYGFYECLFTLFHKIAHSVTEQIHFTYLNNETTGVGDE